MVYKDGYNVIIKQGIQVRLITSKSDCIRLSHGPMRLVHRRNNPNKETLIYIPLSHATGNQAYRIRVANHMEIKQEYITRILRIITVNITGITEIISVTTGDMTEIMTRMSRINIRSITVINYYNYSSNSYI